MKVISMFSGAGGLDLGFMFAGHDIIWSNDFDKDAIKTYNKNLNTITPHEVILGDIVKFLDRDHSEIDHLIPNGDILIGGFPCQGFSIANIGRNMGDSRNFLYLEILKILKIKKNDFLVLENVKGLENMEKGLILKMILQDLEEIGYDVCYNILNACNYGVPQNRERVIIVGARKELKYNLFSTIKTKTKNLKDYKTLEIKPTHSKNSDYIAPYKSIELSNNLFDLLDNKDFKTIDLLMKTNKIYKHLTVRDAISNLPHEYDKNSNEILNHDGTKCLVKINGRVGNRETKWDKISPTIMGRGSGTGGPLIIPHPMLHRRMSVREVARIQSFPDKFEFLGSNTAKYRQIGNAVPPLMAYHIGSIFKKNVR